MITDTDTTIETDGTHTVLDDKPRPMPISSLTDPAFEDALVLLETDAKGHNDE